MECTAGGLRILAKALELVKEAELVKEEADEKFRNERYALRRRLNTGQRDH